MVSTFMSTVKMPVIGCSAGAPSGATGGATPMEEMSALSELTTAKPSSLTLPWMVPSHSVRVGVLVSVYPRCCGLPL